LAVIGKLGGDEGKHCGPAPGDGAVLSGQAGGRDMEGTPGDALPDCRGQAAEERPVERGGFPWIPPTES